MIPTTLSPEMLIQNIQICRTICINMRTELSLIKFHTKFKMSHGQFILNLQQIHTLSYDLICWKIKARYAFIQSQNEITSWSTRLHVLVSVGEIPHLGQNGSVDKRCFFLVEKVLPFRTYYTNH